MQGGASENSGGEETADETFDAALPRGALDESDDEADTRNRRLRWVTAATIAVIVAAGITAFFTVSVCEQQLSSRGRAVKVCRHLQGSDPPVIGLGIVLLAMLGVFFPEISAFGLTIKRDVASLKRSTQENRAEIARNREGIRDASEQAAEVGQEVVRRQEAGRSREPSAEKAERSSDPIRQLADEYNQIRLTMPSGQQRTIAMTRVVTKMITALRDVRDFDVPAHLESNDRGLRLAAYAFLYAYPQPRWSTALAESVLEKEDKPFGQYWGLRALRSQCDQDASALDANTRRRLQAWLEKLPTGSDRANELRAILST